MTLKEIQEQHRQIIMKSEYMKDEEKIKILEAAILVAQQQIIELEKW